VVLGAKIVFYDTFTLPLKLALASLAAALGVADRFEYMQPLTLCLLTLAASMIAACGGGEDPSPSDASSSCEDASRPDGWLEMPTCCGRAGERPGVDCAPPQPNGGIYGACRAEGEEYEAKVLGAGCCPGLKRIEMPSAPSCTRSAPPSMLMCANCGNGACGPGEDHCNCPEDCTK